MTFDKFLISKPITLFKAGRLPDFSINPWEDIKSEQKKGSDANFLVSVPDADTYTAINAARDLAAHIVIEGAAVNPSSFPEYTTARARSARTVADVSESMPGIAKMFVELIPSVMDAPDAIQHIQDAMPDRQITKSKTLKDLAANYLATAIKEFRTETQDLSSVRADNPNVIEAPTDLDELRKMIMEQPGIYALAWQMGEGKNVSVINWLIEQAQKLNRIGAMVAPRKAHHLKYLGDAIHYQTIKKSKICGSFAVGTTNAICDHAAFEYIRKNLSMFISDEHEQTKTHNASSIALGGSILDCGKLTEATNNAFRSASNLGFALVSDAQLSEYTINDLARITGKKIIISHSAMPIKRRGLKLYKNHKHLLKCAQRLAAKKDRVIIFSDAAHTAQKDDLDGLVISMRSARKDAKILMIDRQFVENPKNAEAMKNINATIEAHDIVIISPVLNSGISITTEKVDAVFVMASGTVLPTEFVQTLRRFRAIDEVHVSFEVSKRWLATDARSVLLERSKREDLAVAYSPEAVEHMMTQPGVEQAMTQIARDNKMRENYANRALIMAEGAGFVMERAEEEVLENPDNETGRKNINTGKAEAEEARALEVMNSRRIGESESKTARAKSSKNDQEAFELENYDMRVAYRTRDLPAELLEADKNGWMRGIIKNWKAATAERTEHMSVSDMERRRVLQKLFSCIESSPYAVTSVGNGGALFYTKDQAESFAKWIKFGEMKISGHTIKARHALRAFDKKISPNLNGPRLVKKIMKEVLGLKVENSKEIEIGDKMTSAYAFKTTPEFDFCYSLATAKVAPAEYKQGDDQAEQDAQIDAEMKSMGLSNPSADMVDLMQYDASKTAPDVRENGSEGFQLSIHNIATEMNVEVSEFVSAPEPKQSQAKIEVKKVGRAIDWTDTERAYAKALGESGGMVSTNQTTVDWKAVMIESLREWDEANL